MQSPSSTESPNLTSIAGALLGIAMLLLVRRYDGINHDSILYLGQAFMQRWPGIFGNDLFFLHGSQSQYSLFPWLLARVLNWSSPPVTFLWGSLSALVLFAGASWYCLSGILPPTQRYWAWLGVLCLPSIYGFVHLFSYAEPFLTARPSTEAFCMIALGLLARRQWSLASISLVLAGLLHPLQAIAAGLVIWPWALMQDRRWLHATWFAVPILMLAFAGVRPFDGLFLQTDQVWLYNLHEGTPQLFLSRWDIDDAKNLGFDLLILMYGWRTLRGAFGTWCAANVCGLVLGFVASAILVDGLHLVLPAALQLWRVHWLAHWFAVAGVAAILFRDIDARNHSRALLLTLAATFAWGDTDWGWLVLSTLYLIWPRLKAHMSAGLEILLAWIFGIALISLFAFHAANQIEGFKLASYNLDLYAIDQRLLAFPALTLGLPLLAVNWWKRLGVNSRYGVCAVVLLPLLCAGGLAWDSRSTTSRILEGSAFQSDIFGTDIPENSQVYWYYNSIIGPWLVLRRADYFSPGQIAGQIFNRDTALDARARIERMRPLIEEGLGCQLLTHSEVEFHDCRVTNKSLQQACVPGDSPHPDFIVLPFRQLQIIAGSWTPRDPATGAASPTLYLYRCTDIISELQLRGDVEISS